MDRRAALAVLAASALACGKQTFLVAAFVQTPSVPNPQDPSGTIPPFDVLNAFFGTIDTTDPTKISANLLQPIADADAAVSFRHANEDRVLTVPAGSPAGTYSLSSQNDPRLTFEVGVPYTLVLQTAGADGEAFGARFVPGPPADIKQFQTSTCQVAVPLGGSSSVPRCVDGKVAGAMTIDRTDAPSAGQSPEPAFVLVGRIDPQNPSAAPQITYKTLPDTAEKLLKYVLSDSDYRLQSFAIPGSAFPSAGFYVVSLLAVKKGKVSGNAFLGSTALSGSGSAGLVHAQ